MIYIHDHESDEPDEHDNWDDIRDASQIGDLEVSYHGGRHLQIGYTCPTIEHRLTVVNSG